MVLQRPLQVTKVRFAPSPTGIPHIGNTRTALFNFLFARHNKGEFILRIEDTDQKRIVKEAEESIMEILDWLDINFDGEIIHQSERLEIYKKFAKELLDKKFAYEKDGAVWVKVPDAKSFEWIDGVGGKKIKIEGKNVEDFVVVKSDGFPTYHLANVVDDHLMGITDVIRGEEWISSTPKHIFLYESLGWELPQFSHLPVILGPDHTKLSKRHGAKSVLDFRNEGFVKEALLNFMALLGWNPGGTDELSKGVRLLDKRGGREKEQFAMDELIKLFELKDINTASPIFDIKKLEWINGVWIRSLNGQKKLKERLEEFYKGNKKIEEILKSDKGCDLVNAASSRMRVLKDFEELVSFEKQRELTKEEKEIARELHEFLEKKLGKVKWEDSELLLSIKEFSNNGKVPFKAIFFLMTGKEKGIGILELNQIYGKKFFEKNLLS